MNTMKDRVSPRPILSAEGKNNIEAFLEIIDRYGERLFRKALQLVGDRLDAEDVVQETFLCAFRALDRFGHRSSIYTWLYRILLNKVKDHRIKKKREENRLFTVEIDSIEEGVVATIPDTRIGVEERLERMEEAKIIQRTIEKLRPDWQDVIKLRFYEDLSYAGIAKRLDLDLHQVKNRLMRAKKAIRYEIQKLAEDQKISIDI